MLLLRSVLVVAYGVDILVVVVGYVVITIVAFGGVLRVRSPSTWPRGAVGSLGHQNVPIHLPWVVSAVGYNLVREFRFQHMVSEGWRGRYRECAKTRGARVCT